MLWDKKLLRTFFLLGLFSSVLGQFGRPWKSFFDDDEIAEMELEDEYHGLERIVGWLAGKDKSSGETKKFDFAPHSEKKEITVRNLKDISIHCAAPFQVSLDYDGNPNFKFHNTGSGSSSHMFKNDTHELDVEKYTMFAFLPPDCSSCSGTFICKGKGESDHDKKHETVSAKVNFATDNLFMFSRTAVISSDDSPFIIPCSISEPNATVTLVKLHPQDSIRPVHFEKYDPGQGFTLVKSEDNSEGTFYCIAKHGKNHRALEFSVVEGPVNCTKSCPEHSQCTRVSNGAQEVCECKSGYEETLVSEKCLKPCRNDSNCDEGLACIPQEPGSFFLDILTYPEGKMDSTEDGHHQKRGTCKNPCVYMDSGCGDMECHVADHKPVCGLRKY